MRKTFENINKEEDRLLRNFYLISKSLIQVAKDIIVTVFSRGYGK
jgi:hypothetical protein